MAVLIFNNSTINDGGYYDSGGCTTTFKSSSGKLFIPFTRRTSISGQLVYQQVIFESSDNGATWTKGPIDGPYCKDYGYGAQIYCFRRPDQDFLYFAFFRYTNDALVIWRYNLSTSSWEANAWTADGPTITRGSQGTHYVIEFPMFSVRCEGTAIVMRWNSPQGPNEQSAGYDYWDGATWTHYDIPTNASGEWRQPYCLYTTPDGTVHYLTYSYGPTSADPNAIWHSYIDPNLPGTASNPTYISVTDIFGTSQNHAWLFGYGQTPLITDDYVILTAPAEMYNTSDPWNPPLTLLYSDLGPDPTWGLQYNHLYQGDLANSHWLGYYSKLWGPSAVIWKLSDTQQNGWDFWFQIEDPGAGIAEVVWPQPEILWAPQGNYNYIPEDDIIWAGTIVNQGTLPGISNQRVIWNGPWGPNTEYIRMLDAKPLDLPGFCNSALQDIYRSVADSMNLTDAIQLGGLADLQISVADSFGWPDTSLSDHVSPSSSGGNTPTVPVPGSSEFVGNCPTEWIDINSEPCSVSGPNPSGWPIGQVNEAECDQPICPKTFYSV